MKGRIFKLRLHITRSEIVTCRNMGELENTELTYARLRKDKSVMLSLKCRV